MSQRTCRIRRGLDHGQIFAGDEGECDPDGISGGKRKGGPLDTTSITSLPVDAVFRRAAGRRECGIFLRVAEAIGKIQAAITAGHVVDRVMIEPSGGKGSFIPAHSPPASVLQV